MRIKFYLHLLFLFWALFASRVFAIVPLESLMMGDFSKESQVHFDPMGGYLFNHNIDDQSLRSQKERLALYRGTIDDGVNLSFSCRKNIPITFDTNWDEKQALRAVMATVQYTALDLSIRAIAQYSRALEYTKEEYSNLTENIVGNLCSPNISILSVRQIQKNLETKFDQNDGFKLPSVNGNALFSKTSAELPSPKQALLQELEATIKLFGVACSWGNSSDDPRLLSLLLRDPVLMSYIFTGLRGEELGYVEAEDLIYVKKAKDTTHVICRNLICRKVTTENFSANFPKSVGSQSLKGDLDRLYCEKLRHLEFTNQFKSERISSMINDLTMDDERLIVGQFWALFSGVPNFLLKLEQFNELKAVARSGVDEMWLKWSHDKLKGLGEELYFEESLSLEKVDRQFHYHPLKPEFKVAFDVNLGEIDRITQMVGKIKYGFKIKISKSYLAWLKDEFEHLDPLLPEKKDWLYFSFKKQIESDINYGRSLFVVPPWDGDLTAIIVRELIEQVAMYKGNFFIEGKEQLLTIPVEFYYGPFALKYMQYQREITATALKEKERWGKLEQPRP